ncbi:MAG: acetyl-CoA carboxylase [Schwartzia sp.]|nr:acetyl-CoA carboxylase [Schwartzia sp. (in: firmicutes)]
MRRIYLAAALFLLTAVGAVVWHFTPVPVNSAIGGKVTWVIPEGSEVQEGTELVRISALSGGEIAAARSKIDGVVSETCVKKGDDIAAGVVVARIDKK